MRLVLTDAWFQFAAVIFVVGVGFSAVNTVRTISAPGSSSTGAPFAVAVTDAKTDGSSDFFSRPAPSASDPNIIAAVEPKTPGRWIVDQAGSGEADVSSLEDALFNAKDGDEIVLRPGTYAAERLVIDRSLSIVGEPEKNAPVVIEGRNESTTIEVNAGELRLANLKIVNHANSLHPTALSVSGDALVTVENCRFTSQKGAALSVREGEFHGTNSQFHSDRGYAVEASPGRFSCRACLFTANVLVDGAAVIDNSEFRECGPCLFAARSAKVEIRDTTLRVSKALGAGMMFTEEAVARLERFRCAGPRSCVVATSNSSVEVIDSQLERAEHVALAAHGEAKARLVRSTVQSSGSGIKSLQYAEILVEDSKIHGNDYGVEASGDSTLVLRNTSVTNNHKKNIGMHSKGRVIVEDAASQSASADLSASAGANRSKDPDDVAVNCRLPDATRWMRKSACSSTGGHF